MQKSIFIATTSVILALTAVDSVSAASVEACENYAQRAVQQYDIMNSRPKCRLATDGRWQPNYQNHYGWCRTAPSAWLRSEQKARDDHLKSCGAQVILD